MARIVPDNEMRSRYRKMRVSGKQIQVHRYVASRKLGRPLLSSEVVHHINGNRYDNRPENLQIMTAREHSLLEKTWPATKTPEAIAKWRASVKNVVWKKRRPWSQEEKDKRAEGMRRAHREGRHPGFAHKFRG